MEPIVGLEEISKQRWKLVCLSFIFQQEILLTSHSDVAYVILEQVHVFNVPRPVALLRFMRPVRGKRNYSPQ